MMRIIGYKDLRELRDIDSFKEIQYAPHFCISKTLCEGILNYYEEKNFTLIGTIDELIKVYFNEWVNGRDDTLRRVYLSEFIETIEDNKMRDAFRRSKDTVFKSMKNIIECGVEEDSIEAVTEEEKIFLYLYKLASMNEKFNIEILDKKDGYDLERAFEKILDKRIKGEEKKGEELWRIKFYKGIQAEIKGTDKIVLHGIHKFTPLILKLVEVLLKNNIEIIFLINYNENIKSIYKTWEKVYEWTGLEIEYDKNLDKVGSIVSENYKNILEGNLEDLNLDEKIDIIKFKNNIEMANYVEKIKEEKNVLFSTNANEINNILINYFPERYGKREFLKTPQGQFISIIFDMEDEIENEVRVTVDKLEDCLMASELDFDIEVFQKLKVCFKDLDRKSIREYILRVDELIKKCKSIEKKDEEIKKDYKRLSYFSVNEEDLLKFRENLESIERIIEVLRDGEENIIKKYRNIVNAVYEEQLKDGLKDVSILDKVMKNLDRFSDSLDESRKFKEAMHLYLREKEDDEEPKLIVKDFYHIEGGVLDRNKIYHFMDISDNFMGKDSRNNVWPLDIEKLRKKNRNVDIVKKSLEEGKNYLKFSLFYGLYYGNNNIKISYIEKKKNVKEDVYYIFKLMNLNIKEEIDELCKIKREKNKEDMLKNSECCFKRYMYSKLDEIGVYDEDFLIKVYLKNLDKIFIKNKEDSIKGLKWIAPQLNEVEIETICKDHNKNIDRKKREVLKVFGTLEKNGCKFCMYKNICLKGYFK